MEKMLTIETIRCFVCGKGGIVYDVPESGYKKWKAGAFIQDALPMLSADLREQLLTGTHGRCFDRFFPPDEDDAETPETVQRNKCLDCGKVYVIGSKGSNNTFCSEACEEAYREYLKNDIKNLLKRKD